MSDPQWNEGAFSNFVGLFDRVGLLKNVSKTVGIVFLPAAWHGRNTIPTVFLTFVSRPTLSNIPTKLLNAPSFHCGSDDATIPSENGQKEW